MKQIDQFTTPLRPLRDDYKPLSIFAASEPVPDADVRAGLPRDLKYATKATRRRFKDLRAVEDASATLERMPEPGEAFHCVVNGAFPLWALVPAVAALAAPARIDALHVVTLSFSHQNAAALLALLDAGTIGKVTFVVSHYFKATSAEVYEPMAKGLADRGQRLLAMRTHAKVILFALSDGRRLAVESSANLRSCFNIETFCMIHDAELYAFHCGWIEGLFA